MAALAVIGLGNTLAGDEGIGVRLAAELSRQYDCNGIEVHELGTALFSLVHILPDKSKTVILDCALMGERPGVIRRFGFEEAVSVKPLRHLSLHEGDVFDIIRLAQGTGLKTAETVFFGIEPGQMEWGQDLSPILMNRLDEYLRLIAGELGLEQRAAPHA